MLRIFGALILPIILSGSRFHWCRDRVDCPKLITFYLKSIRPSKFVCTIKIGPSIWVEKKISVRYNLRE